MKTAEAKVTLRSPGVPASGRPGSINKKGGILVVGSCGNFNFSQSEELGMTKVRTMHVYRNEKELKTAIDECKALAGMVEVNESGGIHFELNSKCW